VYLENFKSVEDVTSSFTAPEGALKDAEVLLAWYGDGCYCGFAFVLYRKDGKLFEVNGAHCSCFGLEGQWEPEETTWEALAIRHLDGEIDGGNEAQAALMELVKQNLPVAAVA
jgi:hypothetical protein